VTAVFGAAAVVLDRATFIVTGNSSLSNNTAYHSGGAVHGSGGSRVVIEVGAHAAV
jgi:predicted outer membrane repeat protein